MASFKSTLIKTPELEMKTKHNKKFYCLRLIDYDLLFERDSASQEREREQKQQEKSKMHDFILFATLLLV